MRPSLIAAVLLLSLVPPSSGVGQPQALEVDEAALDRLVAPCRSAARASFRAVDPTIMDRYIDGLQSGRDREELIACGSYLFGARDMIDGRIIPIDPD